VGGEFHEVVGHDVAAAILDHARGENATQIVVGVSRRGRWQQFLRPSIASEVADGSGDIDVYLVSHEGSKIQPRSRRSQALPWQRVAAGFVLATFATIALTAILVASQDGHTLSLDLLLYLALTVACALVGGIWPALFCAVGGSLTVNWFFTAPTGTLTINDPPNAIALAVFILVAVAVSWVVALAARRTEQALDAQRESTALGALSRDLLAEPHPLPSLLIRARDALSLKQAVLTEPGPDGSQVVVAASEESLQPGSHLPEQVAWTTDVPVDEGVHLLFDGPPLAARDQRLVNAYAAHAAILHGREQLVRAAREAAGLARDNAARTTLLAAVSHDLRTPLASIKAGVSTLRQAEVKLTPEDKAELLESIEDSADRLDALIGNLLDLSRLETGSVKAHTHSVEIFDAVLDTVRTTSDPARVAIDISVDTPTAQADLGLLDRVLANVVENALRHSDSEIRITAGTIGDKVQVRIVDRGPGVPDADKDRIFQAFQRVGDTPRGDGLGLGLAVARGLMTVMGGSLSPEDTPGGGLTMVIELPCVDHHRHDEGA
jgi:two-component system sensor histidine kinase KdpD